MATASGIGESGAAHQGSSSSAASTTDRDDGLDLARGLASLVMVHGHALDAWVSPDGKREGAYAVSRFFATLPLPAFLVLCGAALHLRFVAAGRRKESALRLRRSLCRRGGQLIAVGYLASLFSGILDGVDSWATVFRSDVLHVIGLSILLVGLCTPAVQAPMPPEAIRRRVVGCGAAVAMLFVPISGWISGTASEWPAILQGVVGLFSDVPQITRMPLFPLFAWVALGMVAAPLVDQPLIWRRAQSPWLRRNGGYLGLAVAASVTAMVANQLTGLSLGNDTLSRQHPAALWNLLDYGARGVALYGFTPPLLSLVPRAVRGRVAVLGRASLWAYIFHIPFCYGRLGSPLQGQLSVWEAVPFMLALMACSYGVVWLRLHPLRRISSVGLRPAGGRS